MKFIEAKDVQPGLLVAIYSSSEYHYLNAIIFVFKNTGIDIHYRHYDYYDETWETDSCSWYTWNDWVSRFSVKRKFFVPKGNCKPC